MSPKGSLKEDRQEIAHILKEGQDGVLVQKICSKVGEILTSEERVEYVAVQRRPVVTPMPEAVVLTNRRFIIYRPKVFNRVTFDDHAWRDLADVQLEEGVVGTTVTFRTTSGGELSVGYLPKTQARRIYAHAQEKEDSVREEHRQRELEEKRASAGGGVTSAVERGHDRGDAPADPEHRLRKLKGMLDAGLISRREFEAKRAEIMAKI